MTQADHGYRFSGGPVGFLLIHGLGGTPMELRFVAQGLARSGHTVVCPQLAGHCGTTEDLRATGWQDWYGSVKKALIELRKECDIVIVGGLSMGAILALHLAAEHPDEVQGTALYAPTFWLDGWGVPWYSVLFKLVHHKWVADMVPFKEVAPYGIKDERVRQLVLGALESGDSSKAGIWAVPGSCMLELRWLVRKVRGELSKIRQPSLIIHPREDDRSHVKNSMYMARRLSGLTDLVVLNDSYHIVTLDRQRHVVVERSHAFAAWLEKQSSEQRSNAAAARAATSPGAGREAAAHHG